MGELWPHLTVPFMASRDIRVIKFNPVDNSITHIGQNNKSCLALIFRNNDQLPLCNWLCDKISSSRMSLAVKASSYYSRGPVFPVGVFHVAWYIFHI